MVLFVLKLLKKVSTAIAERKHPKQLAAGVATGVLLGLIPHGNLLAIGLLVLILCMKLNHAMMGLVAIGVTFLAGYLDPWSDQVGNYLLTDPRTLPIAQQAWALPMVPWTDLNNTIVLGSFLIGLGLVYPTYRLTLPLFNWIAPEEDDKDEASDKEQQAETDPDALASEAAEQGSTEELSASDTHDPVTDQSASDQLPSHRQMMAVRTRIDLIRSSDDAAQEEVAQTAADSEQADRLTSPTASDPGSILDRDHGGLSPQESLNVSLEHLLTQLRESQDKKAAG